MSTAHRAAAHESWARTENRTTRTAPARKAFDARFPNENARKAYYLRLSMAGVAARQAKRAARTAGR